MIPSKSEISRLAAHTLKWFYRGSPPRPISVPHAYVGDAFIDVELLLGTKTGLFHLKDGSLHRLFDGRVYGITKVGERWYAAVNRRISLGKKLVTGQGYIVSFFLDGGRLDALRVEWCPLDTSVHQIDHWGSSLFVTDTANNRILRFEVTGGRLSGPTSFYPNGALQNGRNSDNYAHINSIYCDGAKVFVLYHNDSTNSGRNSAVATLDMDMNLVTVEEIEAQCAHNVVWDGSALHFCDSVNGRLRNRERVVFERSVYLRGLARSENYWVVGGSDFSTKTNRSLTTGYLFAVSNSGEKLSEMRMPGTGSLYEVRLVSVADRCLSQFAPHRAVASTQ